MPDEVKIIYSVKSNKHRFEIIFGKYKIAGLANSLNEAEEKANFALTGLPEHGRIHSVYEDGKGVLPAKGNIADSWVKDNNEKK
jgi:hypothetical protein